MPFLAGFKTKAREAYEKKKEEVKTGYQKWQQAEPQRARPVRVSQYKTRGVISNGLFVGNGAGLTGIMPTKRKKKAKKGITVSVNGQTIKITKAKKSKRRRKPRASQGFDITNIQGSI